MKKYIAMFCMYRDDPWGNKVPYMVAHTEDAATRLLKSGKDFITRIVEVPMNVSTLIKM